MQYHNLTPQSENLSLSNRNNREYSPAFPAIPTGTGAHLVFSERERQCPAEVRHKMGAAGQGLPRAHKSGRGLFYKWKRRAGVVGRPEKRWVIRRRGEEGPEGGPPSPGYRLLLAFAGGLMTPSAIRYRWARSTSAGSAAASHATNSAARPSSLQRTGW